MEENDLPPIKPYVNINTLTLGLKVLNANAALDIILPAIHTARHPYLLANADTTGPGIEKKLLISNQTFINSDISDHRIFKN